MSAEQPQGSSPRRRAPNKHEQPAQGSLKGHLKVHVSGFPPYTRVEDLKYVFATYGHVKVKLFKKYAILTLPDEDSVLDAIAHSKKISVYGSFLTIKLDKGEPTPSKKLDRFVRSKEKSVIIEPGKIGLKGDFEHQLEQVLDAVRLTRDEVVNISALYVDLENALRTVWPDCCAVPFGSITTGLGIKSSDADCFVRLPARLRGDDAAHVMRTKRLLQLYPDVFAEVFAIPNAHTPIVKFFHVPTETTCDVSFKTPLGSQNSRLVAFLLHSDARLLPLAVVIKYWAKVHELSGTGKVTNYALTMLLVFFLQLLGILPSVESLQRGREDLVDGWNTAFATDPLTPSPARASVEDLLGGFFKFYAAFDFNKFVVCPFLGREIEKAAFANLASLPAAFDRYKRNVESGAARPMKFSTPVCIQDPFQLCHNVGGSVGGKLADELPQYIKFAATTFRESREEFLETILLKKPKIAVPDKNKIRAVVHSRDLDRVVGDEWKAIIKNVIRILFEDICRSTLVVLETEERPGTTRQIERYAVTLTKAVWDRKRLTKLYKHAGGTFLEKQMNISQEIMDTREECGVHLKIRLVVSFPRISRATSVYIEYVDGDKADFQQFGKMFRLMIKGWFFELVKPFLPPAPENKRPGTQREGVGNDIDRSDSIESDDLSDRLRDNCSVSDASK
ncbi:speckle targeted PIP5K1A-regulated poly(A) polymerase-like [Pieris napi]|uniref:speckle targeted PIP5K1A-regulated poly(A) polymerase-like n=1 Tax=Pieris napi TaxID=78633 RepID=UPI001FB9B8D2|nr:speckle targeted PIP5K1A-regulated poly(A) polymerase-like [Pieris napi]XP_047520839.1 speckle targeted PIP5K1A-regulated poly(A) polymerase-like [Pieris napi]XP_047520840.1 speckle targeted PIP5K1A-regulated poly(A) polymerase-like [Pieris napi]XP_047520841.1 speckle targeted PIP5K1A-regulated poly(A) polymerase-like [Pieris napi]